MKANGRRHRQEWYEDVAVAVVGGVTIVELAIWVEVVRKDSSGAKLHGTSPLDIAKSDKL